MTDWPTLQTSRVLSKIIQDNNEKKRFLKREKRGKKYKLKQRTNYKQREQIIKREEKRYKR